LVLHTRVVSGTGGGPEKTILNSPRFLRELGYRCACLYLHPPDDLGVSVLKARAVEAQAEFIGMEDQGPFDLSLVGKLVSLCRERQVAIWHAHDYKTNLLGLLVRRYVPGLKLVTTLHGWVLKTWKTPLYYTLDKITLRHYDAVIAVSPDLRDAAEKWGVREERLHLIYNAIDTGIYCRTLTRDSAKSQLDMSAETVVVGGLGRLSYEKGFDLLIQAADNLVKRGRKLELWIAGEGSERAALERQVADLVEPAVRVVLCGFLKDPRTFLQGLDMFVLSSRREGLPNVILEAMALQVPIVSARVAGVDALIENQVHGLLVEAGSVAQLEEAVETLLDRQRCEELVVNSRRRVEQQFDFRVRMQRMARVYDELYT
jgi:glycosyltransferase involved in cell wall biosynthesis